jgi:formylglycine-generating enzyme required for sulfatase activity
MTSFPLDPFLTTLAADGIRLTSRDYERIALVLQTGGPWTAARLRTTLLALLARDEAQQELIAQRFEDFFTLADAAAAEYAPADPQRILADLRERAQTAPPHPAQKPRRKWVRPGPDEREHPAPPRTKAGAPPRRTFRWWLPAAAVLLLGMVAALGYLLRLPSPPVAPLQLSTTVLNFDAQVADGVDTQRCTLTNAGDSPLTLDVGLTGTHATDFSLAADYSGQSLAAGETLTVTVQFHPGFEAVGSRTARLEFMARDTDITATAALNGTGLVTKPAENEPERLDEENGEEEPVRNEPELPVQERRYLDVPHIRDIQFIPLDMPGTWQYYAAGAAALLCLTLLYALWLWRAHKIPQDTPAHFDPAGPRRFSPGTIGSTPAPWLDAATLDYLADSMGYFTTEAGGRELDIAASIKATMQRGGTPALTFHRRRQVRSLLILEDAHAEATAWNPVAGELAAGIARRGVPVLHGQFQGSPEQFKTPDGHVHRLEDLEDQRQGYLLLIFTDGKNFDRHTANFALEAVARWPRVAWMELREPRGWDASASLPAHYGIPIYPASAIGLLLVAQRFLTEQAQAPDYTTYARSRPGLPDQAGMQFAAYVEQVLGDALLWAQECAMLQPITPGLADALRREFHPDLPPERIERLYALPGTRRSVAGLRFTEDLLRVLRRGFVNRRTDDEQAAVLRFILYRVDQARPADVEPDSLALLAWETIRERVRLELEPEPALKRLAQLAQTPLGGTLSTSLENFGFPDQDEKIPLRVKPAGPTALQRLARIADGFPIRKLEAFPVAWGHRVALGSLIVASVVMSAGSLWSALNVPPPEQNWQVVDLADETLVALAHQTEAGWSSVAAGSVSTLPAAYTLEPDQIYRMTLYGGGHRTTHEFQPERNRVLRIEGQRQAATHPCREAGSVLTIARCPHLEQSIAQVIQVPTWRERRHRLDQTVPGDRLLSVGITLVGQEAATSRTDGWHDLLLQTSSVDVIYTIRADQPEWLARAWPPIQADLGPRLAHSQVVWWTDGGDYATAELEEALASSNSVLALGSDLDKLADLFQAGDDPMITQAEILQALLRQPVEPPTPPVALFRPAQESGIVVVATPDISATTSADAPTTAAQTGAPPQTPWPAITIPIPEMVEIPAGPFLMGSTDADELAFDDEQPQHELRLETYWIGQTEVTNAQFRPFVEGDGYTNPDYWTAAGWSWREEEAIVQPRLWEDADWNGDQQPVVGISWYEAIAYARWLSAQTGHEYRLPTEAEWEKAARGPEGLIWPWGNTWVEDRANSDEAGIGWTTPVGQYPEGASPYGALDMAGNVWEWTATKAFKDYPYTLEDEWTAAYLAGESIRVIRGGGWGNEQKFVRGAHRNHFIIPHDRYYYYGLRLASHSLPPAVGTE